MTGEQRLKVLVAKPGLDGHDKGAKVVCQLLRDAGMEVIYTGLHATIPAIVKAAIEEDVDVVGLSIHSGAHMEICSKLMKGLRSAGFDGAVVVGGVIPLGDEDSLRDIGIRAIFRVSDPHEMIVAAIKSQCNLNT